MRPLKHTIIEWCHLPQHSYEQNPRAIVQMFKRSSSARIRFSAYLAAACLRKERHESWHNCVKPSWPVPFSKQAEAARSEGL